MYFIRHQLIPFSVAIFVALIWILVLYWNLRLWYHWYMEHLFDKQLVKRLTKSQYQLYQKLKQLSEAELEILDIHPQPLDSKLQADWYRLTKKVERVARQTKWRNRFYQKHWYAKFHVHDASKYDTIDMKL